MNPVPNYRDQVRDAIRRRDGKAVLNSTLDHASVIVQEVFNSAEHNVRLLSHRLDPDCYAREGVRSAAKFFLADPDHKVEILVESPIWDTNNNFQWAKHPLLEELLSITSDPGRIQLKAVPRAFSDQYGYNFILLDSYGFRFEPDRLKASAVAAFFPDDKIADSPTKTLSNIFDALWENSQNIPLQIQ